MLDLLGWKLTESKKDKNQKIVYLGLGSNIDPTKNITRALSELKSMFNIIDISSIWESAPVGSKGPEFLNGIVAISTNASYDELKKILRQIEHTLGRIRSSNKNAPRTIDIDILIYNGEILDFDIWTHPYLAIPMAEVFPILVNPLTGEKIKIISERLLKISNISAKGNTKFLA